MQPDCQLLPDLAQIPPQHLTLIPIPRPLKGLIQGKPGLTRQTKVFERVVDQRLLRGARVHVRLHLGQAVGEEEDAVDQVAVGGALDLEVAEEGVGAEEGEGLVEDVVGLAVRVDVVGVAGGGQGGEGVGGAAGLGAEREEGKVAYQLGRVGVVEEDGVVGLWGKRVN